MVKATFKIEDGSFNGEFLGLTFRNNIPVKVMNLKDSVLIP